MSCFVPIINLCLLCKVSFDIYIWRSDAHISYNSFSPSSIFLNILFSFILFILVLNNNKALLCFKYFNSRSPLPFPIDLSPITHVRALPD
ncbi:hypothetical protein HanHA300_Chr13g0487291 [Helianthus annuus]|nr:hypothetical protein HanHA300_Chr13g0487291 [Helianthus annuus]KAJ0498168.1 hypothetical protein HanHA89_Chr13g0519461 [Helianthus annuus]KAJ0664169.1 hypothetical protein HanLR1_Chr13g0489301 [Helianthus annuus]